MAHPLSKYFLFCTVFFFSCTALNELTQIRLDEEDGIPPIEGSTTVDGLDNLAKFCGDAFVDENGTYEITTIQEDGACRIVMIGDFEVIGENDYDDIPDLSFNVVQLVDAVELEISVLTFIDKNTGEALDIGNVFNELAVSVNGDIILDKEGVLSVPTTVRLEGSAVDPILDSLSAREPAFVNTRIEAVILEEFLQEIPSPLDVEFEAQPAIIIGVVPIIL